MSIQDSSPERRNLLLLSMGIIVFYLAGGEFIDQSVRLQIINVHFTKPDMLMTLVWILLLWFIFRYWVTIHSSWKLELYGGINYYPTPGSPYYYYLTRKFELDDDFSRSNYKDRHYVGLIYTNLNSISVFRFRYLEKAIEGEQVDNYKELSTIIDKIVFLTLAIRSFILKPFFSNYVMPYLLAAFAILLGLCNTF